jgi:hypothetical protein
MEELQKEDKFIYRLDWRSGIRKKMNIVRNEPQQELEKIKEKYTRGRSSVKKSQSWKEAK